MRGFFNFIFSKLFVCLLFIAAYAAGIVFICLMLPSLFSLGAAVAGAFVFTAAAAVRAAAGDYPAEFRCSWLIAIAALPVAGAAAYFLTSCKKSPCRSAPPCSPTGCGRCLYYEDGAAFFDALGKAIEGAEKRVYLEFYIIAKGEVFSSLYAKLEGALLRGVEVKIMTDALGSALRLPSKQLKRLKKLGAQVKIFNRLVPPPLSKLNFRDHRKIAVIDGKIAFSGGMNIADEYAGVTRPHGHWKDSAFEVTEGGAAFFEGLFLCAWSGGALPPLTPPRKDQIVMSPVCDSPPSLCGGASGRIAREIYGAKERVWIFTPYLCPDERVFAALCDAAARGADVKILVPAVPDKRTAYAITCDCAARLNARGAGVYAYTPGFMHAKAVICDDRCFLGSYNLDCRSLWLNRECGAFFDGGPTDDVARDFAACLALSAPFKGRKRKLARLFYPLA